MTFTVATAAQSGSGSLTSRQVIATGTTTHLGTLKPSLYDVEEEREEFERFLLAGTWALTETTTCGYGP
ncbi:hypothetical protein [Streptomyces sp. NPDC058279]|uniref:hypothetical protein n=1 Tax=Streptomyces sp. NPDC058279 TaxID=3346418 RepID=UPI0036E0B626